MINQTNKKILIVEDESSLREALTDKLLKQGFDILEAKNGVEGLEIAMKERPMLILLDILMPRMDGIEMVKRLRVVDDWGKTVTVIILTNDFSITKVQEAMENHVFEYLIKSDTSLDKLVQRINEIK